MLALNPEGCQSKQHPRPGLGENVVPLARDGLEEAELIVAHVSVARGKVLLPPIVVHPVLDDCLGRAPTAAIVG